MSVSVMRPTASVSAASRPLSETEFQRQVTDLAELFGWEWVHFRPAQTAKGWRTPVSGPLGAGWVDLVLVRVRDQRLVFAELKSDKGRVTPEQAFVHEVLAAAGYPVNVWRPADFEVIAEVLR